MNEATEFPQEIIDQIVDNVSKDRQTLKNCSLASRSLLSRSRNHLFSSISLNQADYCKGLHTLLTTNPTLAAYIHDATLSIGLTDWGKKPWFTLEATLPSVLDMLTSLRSFSLNLQSMINWSDMQPQLPAALFRLFALQSLSSIHFIEVDEIPITFFNISATIERLELRESTFKSMPDFYPDAPNSLSLKSLKFYPGRYVRHDTGHEFLFAVMARPNSTFSRLTDLLIFPTTTNFPFILPILNTVADSLISLEVNHEYGTSSDHYGRDLEAFDFSLSRLIRLQSLTFTLVISYSTSKTLLKYFHAWCKDLLVILASGTSTLKQIHTLAFTLKLQTDDMLVHAVAHIAELSNEIDFWGQLDEAICSDRASMGLHVNVVLSLHPKLEKLVGIRKVWQDSMQGKLPMIEERHMLTLELESYFEEFQYEYLT